MRASCVESVHTRPLYRFDVLRASLDASDAGCERRPCSFPDKPTAVGGWHTALRHARAEELDLYTDRIYIARAPRPRQVGRNVNAPPLISSALEPQNRCRQRRRSTYTRSAHPALQLVRVGQWAKPSCRLLKKHHWQLLWVPLHDVSSSRAWRGCATTCRSWRSRQPAHHQL